MLYLVNAEELVPMQFNSIDGDEKKLENLIASKLESLFCEESGLMTIFQERKWQPEPDIIALDKEGNLVLFELKRYGINANTTLQILSYAQRYGQKTYPDLAAYYKSYTQSAVENLSEKHCEILGLKNALPPEAFNRKQRLIIVGNASDNESLNAVNYWKEQGLDIDFIPYRFYNIAGKQYFEFFAKPYDRHVNPADSKGILFDSCKRYIPNAIWDMFNNNKVSAYGDKQECVCRFRQNDYVLLYHMGYGVVAVGKIASKDVASIDEKDEKYQSVDWLVPENLPKCENELCSVTPEELTAELKHGFFYASTVKVPYLSVEESKKIIDLLRIKYQQKCVVGN